MTTKGCYIRLGTAAEPMPQAMIDKLFATRTRNSIGNIKSRRQDLSFEQLRIYYDEKGKTLNDNFKINLELITEDGFLNYAAYLLADENGVPVKLAKFANETRVDLIENNEYGYCSMIKATKSVLNKLDIENKTFAKITSKERIEKRMWNAVALREAVINAIVHNDFTREAFPKFEIFSDRIEITSYGSLPETLSQDDFFTGISISRNKELMRIFSDLELVEQLGTGVLRILQYYGKECFQITDNFIRITLPSIKGLAEQLTPQVTMQVEQVNATDKDIVKKNTPQVTMQVTIQVTMQVEQLLKIMEGEHNRQELQEMLGLVNRDYFRKSYLQPALDDGLIKLTVPDKPNSSKQKYRLTEKGKALKK
jgi:predicted HTH transcriptional regulator